MVGPSTLYISLPLVFISAIILIMALFTKREDPSCKHFTFLCSTILLWNIIHAFFAAANSVESAEVFFHLQMLVIPYMPVALLMYVVKFSGFDKKAQLKYVLLACILPTVTVIMNFTNDFHHLFRVNFEVIEATPVRIFINERGPWFWVHTAYSYVAISIALLTIIYKIRSLVRASRLPYYMIFLGSSLSVFTNLFVVFVTPGAHIDSTLWGTTFGVLFIYFAMDTSPTSNYMLARNEVFEAIGEYIFVLNMSGIVTDINRPARGWLLRHGIEADPVTLRMLFEQLQEKGAIIENDENTGRWELFFPAEGNSLFSSFNIKRNYIYDNKNVAVGTIVTFSDMTNIRETLRNLQAISTVDELTGAYNRRAYEKMLRDYEENNLLPLCIVMGDVNGLKIVNDTLGHAAGDGVLRCVARLLAECTGDRGSVARIGGDEFAIIIPGYDESAAAVLINDIKTALAAKADEMLGAGIALGYAVKTDPYQELAAIINEADKKMYQDKGNDRRVRAALSNNKDGSKAPSLPNSASI